MTNGKLDQIIEGKPLPQGYSLIIPVGMHSKQAIAVVRERIKKDTGMAVDILWTVGEEIK